MSRRQSETDTPRFVFDKEFARQDFSILDRGIGRQLWHSDITFENVPSDYASLQIRKLPAQGGGDTLWASAYEAYDRLSPAYQKFLEGLTATHIGQGFIDIANRSTPKQTFRENRGSPENVGQDLKTVHPVIRTNPVTGWKGLFVNRGFTKRINELTKGESDEVLDFLWEHISAVSTASRGERGCIAEGGRTIADLDAEPRYPGPIQVGREQPRHLG